MLPCASSKTRQHLMLAFLLLLVLLLLLPVHKQHMDWLKETTVISRRH
jgi:hypothetical protein